ncbi:ATP-binding protein [Mesorhizobium sp. WSM3882]|uniref:ATP-binding protein n=1 Tax=Mesorhizobium sp. WSM3882 TaxID=2029407 RepID=UPI002477D368|nr:ATP-binding protein [Mesorhizobium sp. WSM3882]
MDSTTGRRLRIWFHAAAPFRADGFTTTPPRRSCDRRGRVSVPEPSCGACCSSSSAGATKKGSTIIITNRPFADWSEVFPNAACVVSLMHRSEVISIEGDSYRFKKAAERSKAQRKKRTSRSSGTLRRCQGGEFAEHLAGGSEEDGVTADERLVSDIASKCRFPDAVGADKDEVGGIVHEGQGHQLERLDTRRPAKAALFVAFKPLSSFSRAFETPSTAVQVAGAAETSYASGSFGKQFRSRARLMRSSQRSISTC